MRESWDALIVGAGPAGASAARELSRRGLRALAIDALPASGHRLNCAGGTEASLLADAGIPLSSPGVRRMERSRFFFGGEMYEGTHRRIERVVLPRRQLDAALVARAREAGACVRFSTRLVALEREANGFCARLSSPAGESQLAARLVIGADGPSSTVAKLAGLPRPRALLLSAAYVLSGVCIEDASAMHFVMDAGVKGGYAWIFPLAEDRANVGIGFPPGDGAARRLARDPTADPRVFRLLGSRRGTVQESGGGLIPVSGPLPPEATVAERLLLAGDAAGMVDATFGEGIAPAVRSGRAAGAVAAEALLADACDRRHLAVYTERWRSAAHPLFGNLATFLENARAMRPRFYRAFSQDGSPRERGAICGASGAR